MNLIQDIGAIAGLAAFIGLAVLALLYFAQARDVRQLRDRAAFMPGDGEQPASRQAAREPATAVARGAEAPEVAPADPRDPEQVEAARLAQLAREAAAERRARFERRVRGERAGGGLMGRFERPEGGALGIIVVGVLLLVAGLAFGASRFLGGDEETASGPSGKAPVAKAQPEIAVLNGTDVPGAAADVGAQLQQNNYKLGAVTNTESPFDTTVVMFDGGGEETARAVGTLLSISDIEPIDPEVKSIVKGASVAVIVGADRAGGAAGESTTDTSATSTESGF